MLLVAYVRCTALLLSGVQKLYAILKNYDNRVLIESPQCYFHSSPQWLNQWRTQGWGGMGGSGPPTFKKVGHRDSHENVIKMVGGGCADLSRSGL